MNPNTEKYGAVLAQSFDLVTCALAVCVCFNSFNRRTWDQITHRERLHASIAHGAFISTEPLEGFKLFLEHAALFNGGFR
jgi:hypothetical protein